MFRSRHSQMFFKTIVIKKFVNFTEKHVSEFSLRKLQALRTPTLFKRDSNTEFSFEICKIFKNNLFYRLSPAAASASLRFPACNFVKKENPAKMFSCEFYRIFKNIFWLNTSGWLLFVFIWEFWEVFQKTSFIEQLISNFNHQIQ